MTTWTIDPVHSEVKFKVKHLVVSTVTGHFNKFNATITTPTDSFADASVSFEADVNSIDTKNEQRDGHLKSPDFFDAEHNPTLSFVSKKVQPHDENEYTIIGDLTIRGITHEVKLNAIYNGTVAGLGGKTVAGFEIKGKLNRQDYGLSWSALTEAGGIVVSDEVKLEIDAEMVKN